MMIKIGILALVCFSGHVLGQGEECFLPGECVSSIHIGGDVVANRDECRTLCKTTAGKSYSTEY